jgi:F420H(2)-dependent quinone reductase
MAPTSASHTPFAIFNRTLNPVVRGLLASPAHGVVSRHLLLLTVTGRKSGKRFTFPTAYKLEGDRLTIPIEWPERKLWWRNLRQPAAVELRLRGARRTGRGVVEGQEATGVKVVVTLDPA